MTICGGLKMQSEDPVTVRSAVMILQCEGSSGSHSEPRQCDRERGFARRIGVNTQKMETLLLFKHGSSVAQCCTRLLSL